MSGRIAVSLDLIAARREHKAVSRDDHGPNRHLAAMASGNGLGKGQFHWVSGGVFGRGHGDTVAGDPGSVKAGQKVNNA